MNGECVENMKCKIDDDCNAQPGFQSLKNNFTCALDIEMKQKRCFKSCSGQAECGVHQICTRADKEEVCSSIDEIYSDKFVQLI